MTMAELGQEIGVAESTISQYENGKREPNIATLIKLSALFGTTVDHLLSERNEQQFFAPVHKDAEEGTSTFGQRMQEALERTHKTQADICKATGIPKSAMSQYVNCGIVPRRERLVLLAKTLGVSAAWLMGFDVPPRSADPTEETMRPTNCVGSRIREFRTKAGLSADELAASIQKDRATVYRYESGDIEGISLPAIEQIAKALNVHPAVLVGWMDEEIAALVEAVQERQCEKMAQQIKDAFNRRRFLLRCETRPRR